MFRFRVAEPGSADFDVWLRLRTELYLDAGLINPEDVDATTGLYRDAYSEHATHLLASDDEGDDIACCRMIESGDGRTLPVADLFGVECHPRSYEASGLAVVPRHRDAFVFVGFYRAMTELADQAGHEYCYSIVEEPTPAALQRFGYPIRVLTEPLFVFNAPNVATVIARQEIRAWMEQADDPRASAMARYYRKPFEWTLTREDLAP